MRLTVLGGSAAGPNAGAGCSGYLVREGDAAIVLDLGPGTVPELKRHIDPRLLDGIVISHPHLDHTLDIGTLRYALKYRPNPATSPIPLWVPPGSERMLRHLALAYNAPDEAEGFYDGVFSINRYDPAIPISINSLTVAFAPTVHYVPTWAMRVSSPGSGGVLGYTADTGPAANLDGFLAGVSVLIAEATLLHAGDEPDEARGHLTAREAAGLAARLSCKTLILTHIWEELGYDRIRTAASEVFRGHIEIARPGLIVEL